MRSHAFLLSLLAAVTLAAPTPDTDDPKPKYMPPGPGDVRSPCPLLNSLANEGILPRNGKGYTVPILRKAFQQYINVGPSVARVVGGAGIKLSPVPNSDSFDLDNLDKHNAIEHDGSLSRNDYYFGNDHSFDAAIFNQTAAYFAGPQIHIRDAALARRERHHNARLANPDFSLSPAAFSGSFTEAAFYLSVFGDPITGVVPNAEWVKYWFREQRLPYALGWTPRAHETNLTTLGALSKKVQQATPGHAEPPPAFEPHGFV